MKPLWAVKSTKYAKADEFLEKNIISSFSTAYDEYELPAMS